MSNLDLNQLAARVARQLGVTAALRTLRKAAEAQHRNVAKPGASFQETAEAHFLARAFDSAVVLLKHEHYPTDRPSGLTPELLEEAMDVIDDAANAAKEPLLVAAVTLALQRVHAEDPRITSVAFHMGSYAFTEQTHSSTAAMGNLCRICNLVCSNVGAIDDVQVNDAQRAVDLLRKGGPLHA
jgi:hypothetical protein